MLVELANLTVADGHTVSVCATRAAGSLSDELREDIYFCSLDRSQRVDWKAMRRLAHLVEERDVTLLHVHGRSSFSLIALMQVLGLIRVPVLLHDHFSTVDADKVPAWFRYIGRDKLAAYVGVSEKLGEWARGAGVLQDKIRVIGNGIDLDRFERKDTCALRDEISISKRTPIGVVVAGMRPEKGIDVLIKAIGGIEGPSAPHVAIAGAARNLDYALQCRRLVEELGLSARVHFLGERSDVSSLLRGADFAVMPSRSESGPLVLIEYLASGLPIVAAAVGEVTLTVARGGIPEVVPPDDVYALEMAMRRVIALSPQQRARRGAHGKAFAKRVFDLRRKMHDWYGVYEGMTFSV